MKEIEVDKMQQEFDKEVAIDNSSSWHLSECLRKHPTLEGKYQRKLSDAIKYLDDLTFSLEIITAEIAEEIFKQAEDSGSPIPASGKDAVLKGRVRLDKRYQKIRKELNVAKYEVSILKGFVKSMDSRGWRLREICKLEERKTRSENGGSYQGEAQYHKSEYDKYKSVDKKINEAGENLQFGDE